MKVWPFVAAAAVLAWLAYRRRRMGRLELVLWPLAAAALCVYGTGVVELPSIERILLDVGRALGAWTYLLVGVLAFLETGAFVGLVAPGETAILLGGFVAGQGGISVWLMMAIVWAAAVAGDVTSYILGRRLGREFLLRHGPRVKVTPQRLERVEAFFARYGGSAIFLGRFVGVVRAVAPFVAGTSRLPLRRFLPYDIAGAGIWGCGLVLLGFAFWRSFDTLIELARRGALALGAAIAIVVAIVAAYRWLRVPAHRSSASAWLDGHAGRPLVGPVIRAMRAAARALPRPPAELLAPRIAALLTAALAGAVLFAALAGTIARGPTTVDARAFDVLDALHAAAAVDAVKVLTALGGLPIAGALTLIVAAVLASAGRRREALALVAGIALTLLAVTVAKAIVDRPRPERALVASTGSSYPSGHSAYAIAWVACALAALRAIGASATRTALLAAAIALAVAIGLSRVYLRAHYLTDVLGGWGLGIACFCACALAAAVAAAPRAPRQPRARS